MKLPFITRRQHEAALARQQTGYQEAIARMDAAYKQLEHRQQQTQQHADRLASHLDDGDLKAIKAWEKRVEKHDAWKPPIGPDAWMLRPIGGGTARPTHPAVDLQRALGRCRALEARLTVAEGRKRAAS